MADRQDHLRRWSALHSDLQPNGLTAFWVHRCYRIARWLRWAPPAAVTAAGLAVATGVPLICFAGGRWALLAAFAAAASGVLDSLDGAVAALTGRASRFGAVLDSLADRCSDTACFVALWVLGAPGWLAGLAAGVAVLQEYLRDRAAGLGLRLDLITIAERPTRVILVFFLLLGAGLWPASAVLIATVGAAVGVALGTVGVGQLARLAWTLRCAGGC